MRGAKGGLGERRATIRFHPDYVQEIQKFAREKFWSSKWNVEKEKEEAISLLKGILVGGNILRDEQVAAVLNGDAYLEGINSIKVPKARYVSRKDKDFKKILRAVRASK